MDEPWTYQSVCVSQALAKVYELALGAGVGFMVLEAPLLFFQPWSDLVHLKGCILWVLVFDIFHFLLLGFVRNSTGAASLSSLHL